MRAMPRVLTKTLPFSNTVTLHLVGASPDGLVSCTCCGNGILEIKCPYSVRNSLPTDVSYITKTNVGYNLSKKHDYFYQVQGQMGVLE